MGVRYGGAKRGKYRFECPNTSSGEKRWQPALPKPKLSLRCALHMGNHPDSRRSTYFFVPFLFIVIEPGCYRSIFFIIWPNYYLNPKTVHRSAWNQSLPLKKSTLYFWSPSCCHQMAELLPHPNIHDQGKMSNGTIIIMKTHVRSPIFHGMKFEQVFTRYDNLC